MDATETFLVILAAAALLWELWAVAARRGWVSWGPRLISPVMREDGRLWLFWPWGWGVLAAHWWWPFGAGPDRWPWLVGATAAVVGVDIALGKSAPRWAPFAAFACGVVVGALTWAMGVR